MNRALLPVALLALAACAHRPPKPEAPAPSAPAAPGGPGAPAALPDLSAAREGAAAVLRAEAETTWRLFTEGDAVDLASAWSGRGDLLDDATLARAAAAAGAPGEAGRAAAWLRAWLVGERLARDAREASRAAAEARAAARFPWNGREVPLREAASLLAGEHDRDRRRALAEAAAEGARALVAAASAQDARLREAAARLSPAGPLALAAEVRGAPIPALAALAESVLARTDGTWRALLADLARREDLAPGDVRARDLPRLLRTPVPPRAFPGDRQLEAGTRLLAGLGVELSRLPNLRVDAGARPGKLPHALAVPVEPPDDVRLTTVPRAGVDALRAVLHELGAAAYYAHVGPGPMEFRRLGPAAVPQTWAILLEEVAGAEAWLAEQGVPREPARLEARAAAARRLLRAREAAAHLLAAIARLEDPAGAASREAELAARAAGCPAEPSDLPPWRLEPDPLLRSAEALRAELVAAQVERFLDDRAGRTPWWRAPAAGAWLREAWAAGSRRTPDEVAKAAGASGLGPEALDAVVRERAGM